MQHLLFTGASGFLGRNILPLLSRQYIVDTCGRTPSCTITTDLATQQPTLPCRYDMVLHAAGFAHSQHPGHRDDVACHDVNHHGTANLCAALEKVGVPHTFIYISTISVYTDGEATDLDEHAPLMGTSAYARSKILAERFLQRWTERVGCHLVILRPALIVPPDLVGLNPPGNLGAMVRAISRGRYFRVADGAARRSMVVASDIARLVPMLHEQDGIFNLAAPIAPSYAEIGDAIASALGRPKPRAIPMWLARALASVGDTFGRHFPINTPRLEKLTTSYTVSSRAITDRLGFTFTPILPSSTLNSTENS